ncbi:MAG: hypothetical protein NVS2B16_24650 [Chloroflexota bacterium]
MALEDFVDPEVGIAVAATALALSPGVRNTIRRGLVYGLAGVLRAGDAVGSAARGAAQGAQQVASSAGAAVQDTTAEAANKAQASDGAATRTRKGAQTPAGE